MKKIAIPCDGGKISQHFGHCPQFTMIKSEEGSVTNKEVISNPGHKPGFLPRFLSDQGVDCVLAGGMGARAVNLFEKNDIEVVTGATSSVDEAVKLYLEGNLETEEDICDH
jgi:predicted Fe-Mo cluster-binding NifX family protein